MTVNAPIVLGSKPKQKKATIFTGLANIALKPIVGLGNLATAGLEKVTKKKFGRTTSEELSRTTAGEALGLAAGGAAAALGIAVAPAAAITVLAPPAAVSAFAPDVVSAVINTPAGAKVATAAAINPTAGIVVAIQEGTSYIEEAAKDFGSALANKAPQIGEVIQENAGIIAGGAGIAAAAAAVSLGEPDLIDKAKSFLAPPELPIPASNFQTLPAPAQEVIGGNYPPMPEPSTGPTKKHRKRAKKQNLEAIRQTVNVYTDCKKSIKRRRC